VIRPSCASPGRGVLVSGIVDAPALREGHCFLKPFRKSQGMDVA